MYLLLLSFQSLNALVTFLHEEFFINKHKDVFTKFLTKWFLLPNLLYCPSKQKKEKKAHTLQQQKICHSNERQIYNIGTTTNQYLHKRNPKRLENRVTICVIGRSCTLL